MGRSGGGGLMLNVSVWWRWFDVECVGLVELNGSVERLSWKEAAKRVSCFVSVAVKSKSATLSHSASSAAVFCILMYFTVFCLCILNVSVWWRWFDVEWVGLVELNGSVWWRWFDVECVDLVEVV